MRLTHRRLRQNACQHQCKQPGHRNSDVRVIDVLLTVVISIRRWISDTASRHSLCHTYVLNHDYLWSYLILDGLLARWPVSRRLAGKNISKMTIFVLSRMLNLCWINQLWLSRLSSHCKLCKSLVIDVRQTMLPHLLHYCWKWPSSYIVLSLWTISSLTEVAGRPHRCKLLNDNHLYINSACHFATVE